VTGSGYIGDPPSGTKEERWSAVAARRLDAIFFGSSPLPPTRRDVPVLEAETTDEAWRTELASRENNGVTVTLFWSRSTNLVTVAVADAATDDYFELVLDEDERALDVFHHPYAHAAARGVEFRTPGPEREVLLDAA
jgi:hypothetical protein